MTKLRVLDLFSGIGGFSLGLERTGGFETVGFCEIEPFPRKVLAKHWPGVPCYDDVRTLTADVLARDGIAVDVITGGFPCQDLSVAGKQRGLGEGTRSGLWSEIVRLVGELRPRYVIVENVAALLAGPSEQRGGWFGRVLGDLAECGYDAEWENIPAAAVGALHRRERVWIVAYPQQERPAAGAQGEGCEGHSRYQKRDSAEWAEQPWLGWDCAHVANPTSLGQSRQWQPIFGGCEAPRRQGQAVGPLAGSFRSVWSAEPAVGRVANGVPNRVDRLAALGNAVVPKILSDVIGPAILQAEAAA